MTKPTLLLTRPAAAAERMIAQLSPTAIARVDIVVSPLLEIVPTKVEVDLADYCGVIFTSSNGVGLAPQGKGGVAYCVGQRTAEEAAYGGWQIALTAENANALVAHLSDQPAPGPLLHLAGKHRRGDVAARLAARGERVDTVTLYDQELLPLSQAAQAALTAGPAVIVPLFSPRSATQFAAQAHATHNAIVVALSEAVAETLDTYSLRRLLIAPEPTGHKMVDVLEKLIIGTSLP